MSVLLEQLRQRMASHQALDRWEGRGQIFKSEAAVLIALTDSVEPEILLTQRSAHLSSHAGEVALPGGKIDKTDSGVIAAALRETHEEIGIEPSGVEVLGRLDAMVTRFGVKVSPVVGIVSPNVTLNLNPFEIESTFSVPLAFFLRDQRLRTDVGLIGEHKVSIPAWQYQGYEIWGVTAVILVTLMNQLFDRKIETGMEYLPSLLVEGKYKAQDWRPVQGKKGITE